MPRNSSGSYTLVSGNPVVANTLIETGWANPTLADIAQAMSDSLDRYGRGSMLAPIKFVDGTVTAPSISFGSESSTGWYHPDSGTLAATVLGTQVVTWQTTGFTAYAPLKVKIGGTDIMNVAADAVSIKVPTTFNPGPVIWATAPTDPAHLVNKAYVDAKFSGAAGGGYLPLAGGTLTGSTTISQAGGASHNFYVTDGPADNRKAVLRIVNTGQLLLGRINDGGTAWQGGIYWEANGVPLDLKTGGTIWHSGNDGNGTGLDADLLKGATLTTAANGWSVAQRDGSGNLFSAAIYASNRLLGGYSGAGWIQSLQGQAVGFGWDGRLHAWVDNGYQHALARWGSDINGGAVTDPGWFSIGGMIFQWGVCNVGNDSSAVVNFSRGFPNACLGAVATPTYNANLSGNQMISCHVLWTNPSGLSIGSSENGPTGVFPIRYFAWGY